MNTSTGIADLQDLYLNLSPDFGGSIDLDLYLTAQSGDKFASSQASFTISVEAVADAPSLTAAVGGSGSEDGKAQDQSADIAKVTLAAQLNDADGSEKLFFDFSGLSNTANLIAPDGKKFAVSSDGSASVEIAPIDALSVPVDTSSISQASGAVINTPASHGFQVGDIVKYTANATALNGLSNLSTYKIASVPSANSFTLTDTSGNAVTYGGGNGSALDNFARAQPNSYEIGFETVEHFSGTFSFDVKARAVESSNSSFAISSNTESAQQ